MEAIILF